MITKRSGSTTRMKRPRGAAAAAALLLLPGCMSKKIDVGTATSTAVSVAKLNNSAGTYTRTTTSVSTASSTASRTTTTTSIATVSSTRSLTSTATATATASTTATATASGTAITTVSTTATATASVITTATATRTATASGTASATAVDSVTAFSATAYPLARRYCASCHASSVQPFFAGADAKAAHDSLFTFGKVDFANPASSRLVLRLNPDRHFCWTTDCAANASEMLAAILSWKNMISAAPEPPPPAPGPQVRFNGISVTVPATLPTGTTFTTLTWPLDSAADTISPEVTGGKLLVDIQRFDTYSYRLKNPRLIAPNGPVYVWDIRFALNGVIRASDVTYSLVDQMVPKNTAGMALSSASMVMLLDKGPGADGLAVSFSQLRNVSSIACKNTGTFTSAVKPVMAASCVRCHSSANVFDMATGTDADICMRTLGRVDLGVPASSPLIVKPTTGTNHQGGGNLINQATVNNWINWINSER